MRTERPPKTHRVIPRCVLACTVAARTTVIVVLPPMLTGRQHEPARRGQPRPTDARS